MDTVQDPAVPDWQRLVLPDAWPDLLDLRKPSQIWRLISKASRARMA